MLVATGGLRAVVGAGIGLVGLGALVAGRIGELRQRPPGRRRRAEAERTRQRNSQTARTIHGTTKKTNAARPIPILPWSRRAPRPPDCHNADRPIPIPPPQSGGRESGARPRLSVPHVVPDQIGGDGQHDRKEDPVEHLRHGGAPRRRIGDARTSAAPRRLAPGSRGRAALRWQGRAGILRTGWPAGPRSA